VAPCAVLLNPMRENRIGRVLVSMHIGFVLTFILHTCSLFCTVFAYSQVPFLRRLVLSPLYQLPMFRSISDKEICVRKVSWPEKTTEHLKQWSFVLHRCSKHTSSTRVKNIRHCTDIFHIRRLLQFQIIVLYLLHQRLKFVVYSFSSEPDGHPTRKEVPSFDVHSAVHRNIFL